MEFGLHRSIMRNEYITVVRNSYEKVKTFKNLDNLLTNENSIKEEIKYRLKAETSCYYSVQTLLSSQFRSKNVKDLYLRSKHRKNKNIKLRYHRG